MPPTDAYTQETRVWLDRRFSETAPDGVYTAHQPIYGFDAGHCETGLLPRYVRTLEIMRALAQLRFRLCLDVGAAEGYKAELVRRLFGAKVVATDLSEAACARAREIFDLTAHAADVHDLPFAEGEFDVAICSETLEHVSNFRVAIAELLRVVRTAVVITVPHESPARVAQNRSSGEPHAHINSFDSGTLDYLERGSRRRVIARPIVSPLTTAAAGLVEGSRRELREPVARHRLWDTLTRVNNVVAPVTSRLLGERAEVRLIELDRDACRRLRGHRAILFVLLKDQSAWSAQPARAISAEEILAFRVPFHYLR